ncbi:MAG: GIY-YIG nuclease family protein [Alphaproteobacteria bacterium]|nr:MAG: GIY-YIG nuclease family protein [Alphaproteobacteria bacterium]
MHYVYIIKSQVGDHYYTGCTENIETRVRNHNEGSVPHTAKYKPWIIKTYLAFADKQQAINFEKYLKTASGRAFAKKRL